jgi:hypothetical protein
MPSVVVTSSVPVVAVEIGGALARRKPVEECAFGVSGQILDHLGYCVTVVTGEASELCPCLNVGEGLCAGFHPAQQHRGQRSSRQTSPPSKAGECLHCHQ